MTPAPNQPHLPSSNLHTHTILPNVCPSDLNQTYMKRTENLFTFCRLTIYADNGLSYMFCTFFFLTYTLSGNLMLNAP